MPALTERDKLLLKSAIGNPESTESIVDAIEESVTASEAQEIADTIQQMVEVNLTSEDILAFTEGTTVDFLPAPGDGNAIIIRYVVSTLNFGTTPYTYDDGGVAAGLAVAPNDAAEWDTSWEFAAKSTLLTASETTTIYYETTGGDGLPLYNNSGWTLINGKTGGGAPTPADGDSSLTIKIYYQIVAL